MLQNLKTSLFVACAFIFVAQSITDAKTIRLMKKRQISGGMCVYVIILL